MEKLVRLQDIDSKLKDLNDLLGDLPSRVDELDKKEQSIKHELNEKKKYLKKIDVEIHKREVNLNGSTEKINKLKDQLFLVTNNKQYDALMAQIDHLKEQKSNFETESIELLDEKETTTENISTKESDLKTLSNDLIDRREKLKSAILESAEQKSDLEKKRTKELKEIDDDILLIYDKVIKHREGIAVVKLQGSGCGGCGAHIPPQTVTEVRAKSGIHTCDMCGRFLYNQEADIN